MLASLASQTVMTTVAPGMTCLDIADGGRDAAERVRPIDGRRDRCLPKERAGMATIGSSKPLPAFLWMAERRVRLLD
jgi:hypothetical protein